MLYNSKRKRLFSRLLVGGALWLAGLTFFSCSDKYDLDSEQPSNLNTIYGFMESQGNYKTFLRLIDDLGFKEILSKTGSKTLFVANDAAFDKFFHSNPWGVSSYGELTEAQRKILLNAAMLDNPYSETMLSTAEGPVRGEVCRRSTALSLYDTVQVVNIFDPEIPAESEWNKHWNTLRANQKPHASWMNPGDIVLFKDASGSNPMIHFTPKFLVSNKIQASDVNFLYNHETSYQGKEIRVGNAKVTNSQFCKNGFVHEVDQVILPLDNLAEVIRKHKDASTYSSILERFAAPYYDADLTTRYNQVKFGDSIDKYVDSVFVKRYFSKRSVGSTHDERKEFNADKDGSGVGGDGTGFLKFDPGWNTFVPELFNDRAPMMEDMAVMIVPTDKAFENFWTNHETGKTLMRYFGSLDNMPNETLVDLVNVNMLNSLIGSVPTRFNTIVDDANEILGSDKTTGKKSIEVSDIDSVLFACNGLVYLSNQVFVPKSYMSVAFPLVLDNNLNILNSAVKQMTYEAYLTSMVSTYSFFLPTNEAMLTYIDPVTYGQSDGKHQLWEFYLKEKDSDGKNVPNPLYARIYSGTLNADGTFTKKNPDKPDYDSYLRDYNKSTKELTWREWAENRLQDFLDNIIVIEKVVPGKKFYRTKGKNYVKVDGSIDQENAMTAAGGRQLDFDTPMNVEKIFAMRNGMSYICDGIVGGSRKAAADIVYEHPDFSEFYGILKESGTISLTATDGHSVSQGHPVARGDKAVGNLVTINRTTKSFTSGLKTYAMLNANHYTMYVPTNDAMQIAYQRGMPSLADYQALEDSLGSKADTLQQIRILWRDFIKYHIHGDALFVDGAGPNDTLRVREYDTLKSSFYFQTDDEGNIKTTSGEYNSIVGPSYRVNVTHADNDGITLYDEVEMKKPSSMRTPVHVVAVDTLRNLLGREYWISSQATSATYNAKLKHSSSIVVHGVDRPLFYDEEQFKYVPRHVVQDTSVKRRK